MALRDRLLTPKVARAMMSPAAIVATGAGAAIGVLTGGGIVAAVVLGAIGWLGRVALAVPRKRQPVGARAGDLPEPWRGFVADAQDARQRFRDAVRNTREGPLRDRLGEIGTTLDHGVEECQRIAQHAADIGKARRNIDIASIQRERSSIRDDGRASTRATLDALKAQLDTAGRMDNVIRDARDRLRLLNARMDESVARAIELSVRARSVSEFEGLDAGVGDLVTQLEALRQALDEPGLQPRQDLA